MYYQQSTTISEPIGNNTFSYEQRKAAGSECKIHISTLIEGTLKDLKAGKEIVFEELDHLGRLQACIGLEHIISLKDSAIPTYIMDNHNHAFYFRHVAKLQGVVEKGTSVIHIDQHADMAVPEQMPVSEDLQSEKSITQYTNEKLNVGNFIVPSIESGLVGDVVQIRTVSKLLEISHSSDLKTPYILDIDIDFRSDHIPTHEEITAVAKFYRGAKLCTIALSPYFMDINKAIGVVTILLSGL